MSQKAKELIQMINSRKDIAEVNLSANNQVFLGVVREVEDPFKVFAMSHAIKNEPAESLGVFSLEDCVAFLEELGQTDLLSKNEKTVSQTTSTNEYRLIVVDQPELPTLNITYRKFLEVKAVLQ